MATVQSVNFYDLCRICTVTTEQKIDIFSVEGKTKNLCAKINECLSLNIDEKDRLPKVLCPQCIHNLETYAEFRNTCRNSQIMLTSCLNTASAQTGGKVLIKDILSSTGKSLSVLNNSSNSVSINNNAIKIETSQNLPNQAINQTLASQLQQQQPPQQQLFTIQGSNVISQSVVNPLTISASGTLQNRDFINSIMQAVGIQSDHVKIEKTQTVPQYTITVDNTTMQQQATTETHSEPVNPNKEKETKNNALEEFLKMKPNIKVTPISKKQQQNQQQQQQSQQQYQQNPQQQLQQQPEQQQLQQQQHELQQQQMQQQEQQQQQNQLVQFQLQQFLQQQLQQQQLQQQLQLLTSQLQPQQITITAPSLQQQTPAILQSTALSAENNLNDNNDDQSPTKNKKPKLNFILTPPNQPTNQALPQLSTVTTPTNATLSTPPQIQLQFQPTLTPQTSLQLQQTQQHQNATTAALLSNLAPLLHPQSQINAALQTQTLNNAAQNTCANILSPNKCFLPITIKDESTDQQFIAHIDAKNFLLPTTYQLQMKFQPQIATADGQPIMQLAPTSIPATLQLAPQSINTNPTFQAAAAAATFSTSSTLPNHIIQQQQQQSHQLQATQIQQHALQQINMQEQQQPQVQAQIQPQLSPPPSKIQSQPTQISQLPKNAQITSQQVLTTGNKKIPSTVKNSVESTNFNEKEKQLPKVTSVSQGDNKRVIKQQKYTISQQPGTNTIEITPTTSFTQQIMQQVQQQQQQKQKLNQPQSSEESTTTTSVTTQHGGITVQRIMTKNNPTAATTANGTNQIVIQSNRQATITPIHQPTKQQTLTLQKLPILNKQNITISRITPQNQQYQSKPQSQQPHATQIANTTLKVETQPIKSEPITTVVNQQKREQALPTRTLQQQTKICKISPLKKVIKKSQPKSTETSHTTTATSTATTTSASQQKQTEHLTTPASPTTQIQYITDITSVLPISNDESTLSAGTKIATLKMPSTTTITSSSTNSTNITNSGQTKSNLECSQCGRIFKKKEHLTQHVKLHSGVRPFKCNEVGCTKAFHRKEHLLRHLVSHSGKKMFSCDICQKPFSRKDNLSKHRKIHTDPNTSNYVCEICNKSFAVKTYYEQHTILHQNKTFKEEDKKTANETATKVENQINSNISNSNNCTNQIEYQTQTQQQQQQLNLVQQQIQQLQQQNQSQQIMHLQLPTSLVTSQDMAGNTITITQANDPQANALKTLTLSTGTAVSSGSVQNHHDATVLNLPTSLANFVQLSHAQFVNTTTGQIMGLKIEK